MNAIKRLVYVVMDSKDRVTAIFPCRYDAKAWCCSKEGERIERATIEMEVRATKTERKGGLK